MTCKCACIFICFLQLPEKGESVSCFKFFSLAVLDNGGKKCASTFPIHPRDPKDSFCDLKQVMVGETVTRR